MLFAPYTWPTFVLAVVVSLVLAIVIAAVAAIPVRLIGKHRGWEAAKVGRIRRPFRALLFIIGVWSAVAGAFPDRDPTVLGPIQQAGLILTIAACAWLVAGVLGFVLDGVLGRYPTDVADNRVARQVHTQVLVIRRVMVVGIGIIAIGAILLTFPGVAAIGTSVLASAGLLSVVAGLAAQSTLANVFAGLQLAFSGSVRVDDVVIVELEWGRIEEITLTYVVVHIWDDRRLVLPSTYFTTTPFQNWTRRSSELLGSVELDVDYRISPAAMREELDRILETTDLWDRRAKVLQVTDATLGRVRIRVLVTARDAPTLFDLRCLIREELVEWLHREGAAGIPVQRVEIVEPPRAPAVPRDHGEHEGLFTGSVEAEDRASTFTQSIPVQTAAADSDVVEPDPAPTPAR